MNIHLGAGTSYTVQPPTLAGRRGLLGPRRRRHRRRQGRQAARRALARREGRLLDDGCPRRSAARRCASGRTSGSPSRASPRSPAAQSISARGRRQLGDAAARRPGDAKVAALDVDRGASLVECSRLMLAVGGALVGGAGRSPPSPSGATLGSRRRRRRRRRRPRPPARPRPWAFRSLPGAACSTPGSWAPEALALRGRPRARRRARASVGAERPGQGCLGSRVVVEREAEPWAARSGLPTRRSRAGRRASPSHVRTTDWRVALPAAWPPRDGTAIVDEATAAWPCVGR